MVWGFPFMGLITRSSASTAPVRLRIPWSPQMDEEYQSPDVIINGVKHA
jgi:hypothetical protein